MEAPASAPALARSTKRKKRAATPRCWTDGVRRRVLSYDIGERNLAEVALSLQDDADFEIHHWARVDLLADEPTAGAARTPMRRVISALTQHLYGARERTLAQPVDAILIEQQMQDGTRYKMIATAIQIFYETYYLMRQEHAPPILFLSAKSKLRVFVRTPRPVSVQRSIVSLLAPESVEASTPQQSESAQYRARKRHAMDQCAEFLRAFPRCRDWQAFYTALGKKRDDAADTLLQAIFYLKTGPRRRSGVDSSAPIVLLPDAASQQQQHITPRVPLVLDLSQE